MKKISVVIINKNDPGIADTLSKIYQSNTEVLFEVIIVDASAGKLDYIAKDFPSSKWIKFNNYNNKKFTIPDQRNIGVRSAKGAIIVFIDANCIPEDKWLERITSPILFEDEAIVAGATFSRGSETLRDLSHYINKDKKYITECPTINLAFLKSMYEEIGGFDESFEYGSDVDFSWRAVEAGYKIRYVPNAIVRHDWGDSKQEIKRSFRYGKARMRLYLKHHHLDGHKFRQNLDFLAYPIFLLGLPIVLICPWYLLLILIPLVKNFRHSPFKLIAEHLVFAAGSIYELITMITSRRKRI